MSDGRVFVLASKTRLLRPHVQAIARAPRLPSYDSAASER
jgi:hypothetical protein